MNNFDVVLLMIKDHCKDVGVANETCIEKIEEKLHSHKNFLSAALYLDVLDELGLIRYSKDTKGVTLTEKGKYTEHLFSL